MTQIFDVSVNPGETVTLNWVYNGITPAKVHFVWTPSNVFGDPQRQWETIYDGTGTLPTTITRPIPKVVNSVECYYWVVAYDASGNVIGWDRTSAFTIQGVGAGSPAGAATPPPRPGYGPLIIALNVSGRRILHSAKNRTIALPPGSNNVGFEILVLRKKSPFRPGTLVPLERVHVSSTDSDSAIGVFSLPASPKDVTDTDGKIVGIYSPKGGFGTSTLSITAIDPVTKLTTTGNYSIRVRVRKPLLVTNIPGAGGGEATFVKDDDSKKLIVEIFHPNPAGNSGEDLNDVDVTLSFGWKWIGLIPARSPDPITSVTTRGTASNPARAEFAVGKFLDVAQYRVNVTVSSDKFPTTLKHSGWIRIIKATSSPATPPLIAPALKASNVPPGAKGNYLTFNRVPASGRYTAGAKVLVQWTVRDIRPDKLTFLITPSESYRDTEGRAIFVGAPGTEPSDHGYTLPSMRGAKNCKLWIIATDVDGNIVAWDVAPGSIEVREAALPTVNPAPPPFPGHGPRREPLGGRRVPGILDERLLKAEETEPPLVDVDVVPAPAPLSPRRGPAVIDAVPVDELRGLPGPVESRPVEVTPSGSALDFVRGIRSAINGRSPADESVQLIWTAPPRPAANYLFRALQWNHLERLDTVYKRLVDLSRIIFQEPYQSQIDDDTLEDFTENMREIKKANDELVGIRNRERYKEDIKKGLKWFFAELKKGGKVAEELMDSAREQADLDLLKHRMGPAYVLMELDNIEWLFKHRGKIDRFLKSRDREAFVAAVWNQVRNWRTIEAYYYKKMQEMSKILAQIEEDIR